LGSATRRGGGRSEALQRPAFRGIQGEANEHIPPSPPENFFEILLITGNSQLRTLDI
jgi:hypothetical protein